MGIASSKTPARLGRRRAPLSAHILVPKMRSPSNSAVRRRPVVRRLEVLGLIVASAAAALGLGISLASGSVLLEVAGAIAALSVLFIAARLQRGRLGRLATKIGPAAAALVLGLTLCAVDTEAVSKSVVYVIVFLVLAFRVFGARSPRGQGHIGADVPLALLLAWGTIGTVLGRIMYGQGDNALPFFVPMFLALIHVYRPLELTEEKNRRLSYLLVIVSTLYVTIAVFASLTGVSWMLDFMHQRSFFLVIAFAGAILLRRWWLLVALTAAALLLFFQYPALTYVVVAAGGILVALIILVRRPTALVITAAGIAAIFIIVSAGSAGVDVTSTSASYFSQVGKSDNTRARDELLMLGEQRISQSPLLGSNFTDDLSVRPPPGYVDPYTVVPVHNDYVQFTIGGGVIGGGLLACVLGLLVTRGVRVARATRVQGRQASSQLATILTAGIFSMALIAFFNPILIDLQNALCLAIFYDILASIDITSPIPELPDVAAV